MRTRHDVKVWTVMRFIAALCALVAMQHGLSSAAYGAIYTVTADRDAFVQEDKPNENNGDGNELELKSDNSNEKRRIPILGFTLPAIPSTEFIVAAELRLYVRREDSGQATIHRIGAGWAESTVTWNVIASAIDSTVLATISPNTKNVYILADITQLARDWRSGAVPNHGVAVRPVTAGIDVKFGARERKEADQRPVLVITTAVLPVISVTNVSTAISDPVGGQTNPFAIPGAVIEYVIMARNSSSGTADSNSTVIAQAVPAHLRLFVGDIAGIGSGPVQFIDGTPSSGLSYSFGGLGLTTDRISFSDNAGVSYAYVPVPDANGFDANVTNVQVNPAGIFAGNTGSGEPNFTIRLRMGLD